ncbi:MAG: molybdopterin-dependent oxidoreductase [Firmicutes bacterium]|nr:molybdopterin-dependent oxidoreductase [Bacillota bacterium]
MSQKISRRDLLKSTAFLGTTAFLASQAPSALGHLQALAAGQGQGGEYELAKAENVIYGVCLQCNTQCTLKGKILDGVLVKVDGNAYSPQSLLPPMAYNTDPQVAARVDGKLCPKGQSTIQTQYDPYRIRKVLKRAGPRGSNKWEVIAFDQAIKEIVNGGKLFGHLGEDRQVPGFKEVLVTKDAGVFKSLAGDAAKVAKKEMTPEQFKEAHKDHLNLLIDPDHPDLGVKNNQFVFQAGRIEPGRADFSKRFVINSLGSNNWYEHTTICEQSHHVAFKWFTADYSGGSWNPGPNHLKPDYLNARFIIFWGTGAFEANFGPTPMAEQVTRSAQERGMKIAVVDPRFSKTAAKAQIWVPVKPGDGDLALAMGMIRWIIESNRYDARFLENANKAAASADGEKNWSNAAWLVKLDQDGKPGALLRASEVGLSLPDRDPKHLFVVSQNGKLLAVDPKDDKNAVEGDLLAEVTVKDVRAKTAFQILKEAAGEKSLEQYADLAGIKAQAIIDLAREFTSYGKLAAIDFYRGGVQHTNGYYTGQAIIALNLLIGNFDWRGGLSGGGGSWAALGGKAHQPFDLGKMHPGKIPAFGVKMTREAAYYDKSTLFSGFPAKRPWYPFTTDVYQEIIPAIGAEYPYPAKILWLHKGTPALATPAGSAQIKILMDTKKVPLFIATDIVIGETSMYADYLFPDISYVERWAFLGSPPSTTVKTVKIRQPIASPVPEMVKVGGEEMPISMEAVFLAISERLSLPGYGAGGFGPGWDFKRPEDYYLKAVANIAAGDSPSDTVPAADSKEMGIFLAARKHLPKGVFSEAAWKAAVGSENWARAIYVLNRGGRFEDFSKAYSGDYLGHPISRLLNLYVEPVAVTKDSITGINYSGVARHVPIQHSDGKPVAYGQDYPLRLITFKEIFGGQSRTAGNYWAQNALLPENFLLMHPSDATRLGIRDGDLVRVKSPTNPEGAIDLGNGHKDYVQGRARLTETMRPGVVAASWHYGHWAYGARDVVVNGKVVKGDHRRGTGLCTNPVLLLDGYTKTTSLTDPIGGSASFYDTAVKVERVG